MAIRFPTGPVKLAYDIVGGGEPPLVVIPGWVSNLQLDRDTPLGRGSRRRSARAAFPYTAKC